ncbi:MAG: hypothetical protein IJQ82_00815 [Selenomonadaceae bacterium]|nr:hypothetical protein [Selenomonadaceae bacterium]
MEEGVEFPDEFSLGDDFKGTIEIPVEMFATVFTEGDHALSSYKANLTASGVFLEPDDEGYEIYKDWSYTLTYNEDDGVILTINGTANQEPTFLCRRPIHHFGGCEALTEVDLSKCTSLSELVADEEENEEGNTTYNSSVANKLANNIDDR